MSKRVCPWWLGYWLISPLRGLIHKPRKILGPYVRQGMTVLDIGSGMGFFSLPLARMVDPTGKVICLDIQERMLRTLKNRVKKAGLESLIEPRLISPASLEVTDLQGKVDFVLAFAVVHEVPRVESFFREVGDVLSPGGKVLVAEPKGHVSATEFSDEIETAKATGFTITARPEIFRNFAVVLEKKNPQA